MFYLECRKLVAEISEIIDRDASPMTRVQFYSHLMMCKNCRRYFKQFKRVNELAGKVAPDDLLDDFDHVMALVMKEIDEKTV